MTDHTYCCELAADPLGADVQPTRLAHFDALVDRPALRAIVTCLVAERASERRRRRTGRRIFGDADTRCEHACAQFTFIRSEEHTSELQSLMRISYAVFCLKKTQTTPHALYSST